MQREQVKEQIIEWLNEEQQDWQFRISKNEEVYYFSSLVKLGETLGCNVCIDKNIDRVIVVSIAKLSEQDGKSYRLTPQRKKFWTDLKMKLVPIGVSVNALPDLDNLESIQLIKLIYFDAWSRDKLIESILKVADALELTQLVFNNFAESVSRLDQKD